MWPDGYFPSGYFPDGYFPPDTDSGTTSTTQAVNVWVLHRRITGEGM